MGVFNIPKVIIKTEKTSISGGMGNKVIINFYFVKFSFIGLFPLLN